MEIPNLQPNLRIGPFKKLLLTIAGVDEETLRKCPNHDHEAIYAIAAIQLCVWCFEASVFYLIGVRLASAGEFHPEILLGALGLATFMLMVDSFVVLRSGWHLSGIVQLKRGGLDVSGGPLARLKATTFLFIRIQLSGCIALLSGIFFGLLVFASDLDARTGNTYRNANNQLIAQAAENVDAAIQRATEAVGAQNARVEALSTQLNTLRQHQVDPAAAAPAVQQTQQEVAQLLARKAKLDDGLLAAEAFGSQELAGAAGEGHSGKPGAGPRHRAAMELVANAKTRLQETAHELDATRARLDTLRKQQQGPALEAMRQQAHDQLPVFETRLAEEQAKRSALNDELTRLTRDRGAAIRATIEKAPDYVAYDNGLLTQIKILDQIAQENPKVGWVILLIDVTAFGLELAAVLAKVTSFLPTTYAALLARDAYMGAVRIVDAMVKELNPEPSTDPKEPAIVMPPEPANDNWPAQEQAVRQNPFNGPDDPPPPPPKRPRGRPRKSVVPTEH